MRSHLLKMAPSSLIFLLVFLWLNLLVSSTFSAENLIVRLTNGSYSHEGRVEVYSNSKWHNVCGYRWEFETADLICKKLGYYFAIHRSSSNNFGQGSSSMLSVPVVCEGSEKKLEECNFKYDEVCPHSRDVGVVCSDAPLNIGSVRIDGTISYKSYACGEVQVYLDGRWGGICDKRDTWNEVAAGIACKQMGFDGLVKTRSTYTHKTKQVIGSLYCTGKESTLLECQYDRETSGCLRRRSSPYKVGVMLCCYYRTFTLWFCFKLLMLTVLLVGIPLLACVKFGWWHALMKYMEENNKSNSSQHIVYQSRPTTVYEEVQYTTVTRRRIIN